MIIGAPVGGEEVMPSRGKMTLTMMMNMRSRRWKWWWWYGITPGWRCVLTANWRHLTFPPRPRTIAMSWHGWQICKLWLCNNRRKSSWIFLGGEVSSHLWEYFFGNMGKWPISIFCGSQSYKFTGWFFSAQISVLKRKTLLNHLLYIKNFVEQNCWSAANHFSFWHWELGGTVKKRPPCTSIQLGRSKERGAKQAQKNKVSQYMMGGDMKNIPWNIW